MKLLILLCSLVSFFTFDVMAASPFKSGQIVVKGQPSNWSDYKVIKYLPHADLSILQVAPGKESAEIRKLAGLNKKAFVNLIAKISEEHVFIPEDPYLNHQWQWGNIQARDAWGIAQGHDVVVAVLDTGIAIVGANDGVNVCDIEPYNATSSQDTDVNGHGTHVSGTIAQKTHNGVGVAGLAYGSCVLPIKVLGDNGSGTFADIIDGVNYALNKGAKVINLSLGTSGRSRITSYAPMDDVLEIAHDQGVVVVAAAGNDGWSKNVSYPAIVPSVIAVGATGKNDQVARYSNKGKGLDLVAPGGDMSVDGSSGGILQETLGSEGWNYYFYQGTSMASPHVAALTALLISHGDATTPDEVLTALTTTTKDIYETGFDKTSGWGLIQAQSALNWKGEPPPVGEGCIDMDNDSFCSNVDCDDDNSSVHPGANDTRGKKGRDGIDNDCNGVADS